MSWPYKVRTRKDRGSHTVLHRTSRPTDPGAFLGHALGRAGRRDEAEKLAASTTNPLTQALIFAGLGDKERTFEALDRMTVLGPVRIGRDLNFPELDLIRGDPRVKALRKKVGLPD